jgi:hypothetical protein
MGLPSWPGDYFLKRVHLTDEGLLKLIQDWETWDFGDNQHERKEQIRQRRLALLYSELDVRTS